MTKIILIALFALSLVGSADAQQQDSYRVFDLRFLVGTDPVVRLRAELPLWHLYSPNWEREDEGLSDSNVSLEQVAEMIREAVAPASWEIDGNTIEASWGSIIVRNDEAVLDQVEQFVGWLRSALLRPVTVDVYRVPVSLVEAGGALTPEQVERLVGMETVRLHGRMEIPSGRIARIRSGQRISYLADYDVEVAQESQIADPIVVVLETGLDLRVGAWTSPTGQVALRVAGRDCSLEQLKKRDSQSTWVGQMQFPRVDSQVAAAAGVMASGGGLLFGAGQGDDDTVFLVRGTVVPVESRSPLGGRVLVPFGILVASQPQNEPLRLGMPTRSGAEAMRAEGDVTEDSRLVEVDRIIEMCRTHVDPQGWDEDPYRSLWTIGGQLFVQGPDEVLDGVQQLVARMNRAWVRNVGLEFRVGVISAAQAAGALAKGADVAALAGRLDTRAWASALSGDAFRHILGSESAYLKDHDVEIAQKATIADPVMATVFGGVAFQGRATLTGSDRVGLRGDFVVQDVTGLESMDGEAIDVGAMDVPRTATTRHHVAQTVEVGRWTILRLSPRPGTEDVVAILVRASL